MILDITSKSCYKLVKKYYKLWEWLLLNNFILVIQTFTALKFNINNILTSTIYKEGLSVGFFTHIFYFFKLINMLIFKFIY